MNRNVLFAFLLLLLGLAVPSIAVWRDDPSQQVNSPSSHSAGKFTGTWEGTMEQPGFDPFPVTVELKEFERGKWCGVLRHSRIGNGSAEGRLLGISFDGTKMVFAATIFSGRENCLDGLSELTLSDDNTMKRVWIDPNSGKPGAKGVLKRQPE
jgi:hypothetical protein